MYILDQLALQTVAKQTLQVWFNFRMRGEMNIIDNFANLVRLEAVVTVIIINFLSDGEGIIILRSESPSLTSSIIRSLLLEVWG